MKHPVRDRLLILICALGVLCGAAGIAAFLAGKVTLAPVMALLGKFEIMNLKKQLVLGGIAVLLALFALLLLGIILPAKKKRSSTFAYQQNESGMVRISLKTLEALVQRCLKQHDELKVVSSSLFSDEETVQVDVHITLQSDISMPLAISALQKQIRKYLEACSGVNVGEVRVFVDGAMPAPANAATSPYAIPANLLGLDTELPTVSREEKAEEAPAQETEQELVAKEETAVAEPEQEKAVMEETASAPETEEEDGEQIEEAGV